LYILDFLVVLRELPQGGSPTFLDAQRVIAARVPLWITLLLIVFSLAPPTMEDQEQRDKST
jgi:hypothetical protein